MLPPRPLVGGHLARRVTAGRPRRPPDNGHATIIVVPDTRKEEPGTRSRRRSPAHPPASVADSPVAARIPPNVSPTRAGIDPVVCLEEAGHPVAAAWSVIWIQPEDIQVDMEPPAQDESER
jgi:hypothetical protein